jgi:tetratricopeptide (TPR) repeat protein
MRASARTAARALAGAALLAAACSTPVERGERLYREGDRLGALEIWRSIPQNARAYPAVQQRIPMVEAEFERLVVRYQQRARYYESKGRLAESILNDRLALELQPDDAVTLSRVQAMARVLAARKAELMKQYRASFAAGDLGSARRTLAQLHTLDAFDPELETEARALGDALRSEVSKQIAMGRRGFASGNFTAAQHAFEQVLELDPDNESAQGYISYIDTLRRERTRTGGGGKTVASSNGGANNSATNFAKGDTFASQAEIRAEGFYQNGLAAARRGDYYAAIRQQLFALGANADHAGAQQELARLRRQLAPEVEKRIENGRLAFRNEDLQSAIDEWRMALLIDPENERTRAYLGHAERQLENLERMRSEPDSAAKME